MSFYIIVPVFLPESYFSYARCCSRKVISKSEIRPYMIWAIWVIWVTNAGTNTGLLNQKCNFINLNALHEKGTNWIDSEEIKGVVEDLPPNALIFFFFLKTAHVHAPPTCSHWEARRRHIGFHKMFDHARQQIDEVIHQEVRVYCTFKY